MLVKAKMFHTGGDCAACHPLAINYCSLLLRLSHVRKISMKETWCIWRTRNVKFPFRWSTKPRDQKQKTGNDCDVISGLEALRKTDFSAIFWLWANKFAKKWCKMALFKENRKMSEKSVFPETLSPEMTSQSFPVSRFWSRGFVPHRKWNWTLLVHQNIGKRNRYRKTFFAILISTLWRLHRANWKKSVIDTLNS